MTSIGSGYGKVILFGEHFVVYQLPALAAALGSKTECRVEEIEEGIGWEQIDNRPATPGYKEKKIDQHKEAIDLVLKAVGVSTVDKKLRITYGGDLIAASGVGSSAAACSSLARALNDEFNLGLSDEQINEAAYEGEKAYHGKPSGIDNTVSTYGGLLRYRRTDKGPEMTRIQVKKPVEIILGNTGITADTAQVVGEVRELKEAKPDWFKKVVEQYIEVVREAETTFGSSDWHRVGELMNRNHSLLKEITVSCEELDTLVNAATDAGALGAKLTGTGRGGIMIALTPGEELQAKVADALEKTGKAAYVWKFKVGI